MRVAFCSGRKDSILDRRIVPESPEQPFRMTERQKRLLQNNDCPVEFIINCDNITRFECLMGTYVNGPTTLQREYLIRQGVRPNSVKTKELSSEIIGRIKESKPASRAQLQHIDRLKGRHGINLNIPANLKEAHASRLIMEMGRTAPTNVQATPSIRAPWHPHPQIP